MGKNLDFSIIEGAEKAAKYPSEVTKQEITKKLPWKTLKGKRITVVASSTTLWAANPRNFGTKDVSDLLPLIEESGGNSIAVEGRWQGNKIEVIAGSRRRESCILATLPLTVDVYEDCSDEDAEYIAQVENQGRKDLTVIGYCNFLYANFHEKKENDSSLTVEAYAKKKKLNRTSMQERFAIAKLPRWLQCAAKQEDTWSVRQAKSLASLWGKLSETNSEDDIRKKLKIPVTTPTMLLTQLKSHISNGSEANDEAIPVTIGEYSWKINRDRKGKVRLQTENAISLEQYDKLLKFLEMLK